MSIICEQVAGDKNISGNDENNDSVELTYIVCNSNDLEEGKQAVLAKAPSTYLNCPLSSVSVDRIEGSNIIYFRVNYKHDYLGAGAVLSREATVSFDLSQSSAVIKRAYAQTKYGTNAPDPGLAIGWNGKYGDQLEIAGVSVPVCAIRKKYARAMQASDLTVAWERLHAQAFGRVNSSAFGDYKPGEVLFLGCSYSGLNSKTNRVIVEYNMGIAFNETNCEMGLDSAKKMIKISKTGWAYVWEIVKSDAEQKGQPPRLYIDGLYVANVYKTCNFKIFGLDDMVR